MSVIRNFSIGEYYHICTRTVLGIPEFKDRKIADRLNFIFLISNSTVSTNIFKYIGNTKNWSIKRVYEMLDEGERLTNILSYVIMPNHYHLLMQEIEEGGIQTFLHTSNTAIAMYVNSVNIKRGGPLFKGRYKAKHVDNNTYLLHLSRYHHLNPLDIFMGREWRRGKLRNWKEARTYLADYPWSSMRFYTEGEKNLVLSGTEVISEQFKTKKAYEKFLQDWSDDSFNFIEEFIED